MKRIGILTYHRSLNYGAVMQSVALSGEIKKRFPDCQVDIIDYGSRRMDRYYKMITVYRGKESLPYIFDRVAMYRAFQRGLKQLPLSKNKLISDNCERFYSYLGDEYDILITGSDAVWNYKKRGIPNPYFLSGDVSAKRLSYAASCNGLGIESFSDITDNEREYLKSSFEKFQYIGVRDSQTEQLVKSVCPNLEVHHNCDPSILLNDLSKSDTAALADKLKKKYGFDVNKPTIAFMMSNLNGAFREEIAKRIKEKYKDKYQTVSLYSYNKNADIPYMADLTPQEWSIVFGLFDLTVSKYFHGTMFSLLNRTPVIAVGAEKSIDGLPNKVSDALGRMGLEDFYFPAKNVSDVDWDALMNKIDEGLSCNLTDRITKGISSEIKTGESFFENLKSYII